MQQGVTRQSQLPLPHWWLPSWIGVAVQLVMMDIAPVPLPHCLVFSQCNCLCHPTWGPCNWLIIATFGPISENLVAPTALVIQYVSAAGIVVIFSSSSEIQFAVFIVTDGDTGVPHDLQNRAIDELTEKWET